MLRGTLPFSPFTGFCAHFSQDRLGSFSFLTPNMLRVLFQTPRTGQHGVKKIHRRTNKMILFGLLQQGGHSLTQRNLSEKKEGGPEILQRQDSGEERG